MKAVLLAIRYAGIKMLFLRRTYRDLERNHVRELEPLLKGIARYSKQEKCFYFNNGSLLEMGYCDSETSINIRVSNTMSFLWTRLRNSLNINIQH